LKNVLDLATKEDLKNIKYVVIGSAKCPQEIFDRFRELCPQAKLLEGYGITECSPVVTLSPLDKPKE
jgi:long-chain-fatty-acid--[acyl-carrier-protein] ligase